MLRVLGEEARLCDGLSRRQLLQVGGLGLAGLSLPQLLSARPADAASRPRSHGKARSCILLYLVGGPPQHETFDPKPEAPAEIRGPFKPISTPLPGLQVGELMPQLGALAQRYSVVRSVATDVNAHTGSGYWMLTGRPHTNQNGESIPAASTDWPTLGAIARRFLSGAADLPSAITLPEPVKNNPGIFVAGQTAGFLSAQYEPMLLECDPSDPKFEIPGLSHRPELPVARLERRRSLLDGVNEALDRSLRRETFAREEIAFQQAYDLLTSGAARRAFDLTLEPPRQRERYGPHRFGQSCLLARRLVEAGTRLVQVNWPREPGSFSVGNPVWDTHSDHVERIKNHLMPPMDQAVSALLLDLEERGLLDETLVLWMGEFGRTPQFNAVGGRDHWGHCFSIMMAGGGIRPGVIHGASDRMGAYPESDRVGPEAVHATVYHCLGIPLASEIRDRLDRPLMACEGEPISSILL